MSYGLPIYGLWNKCGGSGLLLPTLLFQFYTSCMLPSHWPLSFLISKNTFPPHAWRPSFMSFPCLGPLLKPCCLWQLPSQNTCSCHPFSQKKGLYFFILQPVMGGPCWFLDFFLKATTPPLAPYLHIILFWPTFKFFRYFCSAQVQSS